jgi:diguanylate cyclase (GGDEF)-like protein/PAS domain S-box-containing protein
MIHNETSRPTVLIVDDDEAMRFLAQTALEAEGCKVLTAEDGAIALSLLDDVTPDLVLLDVMMPNMNGFTFCQRLRELPEKARIPVLMMTGLDDVDSIRRAYEVGATDFITKPVNWLILGHHVQYLLRASGAFEDLYRSEEKNKALLDAIPDGMFRIDENGLILEMKEDKERLLGNVVGPVGTTVYEAFPTPVARDLMERVKLVLASAKTKAFECGIRSADALQEWDFRVVKSGQKEVLVISRNITERKRMMRALKESEERYALAAQAANDGLWDWDLRTNGVHFSERWAEMLGYRTEEISNNVDEWFEKVSPDDIERLKLDIANHLNGQGDHLESEYRMQHKDGVWRWMLTRGIAVKDGEGRTCRVVGSQSDISARKQAEEQLLHDAFYDTLTGLPNRALFMDRLGHALRRMKRGLVGYSYAVLFVDLDRFKAINDSIGHTTGDAVLVEVAERLEKCIRPGDTVARIGGDEFVLLLEDIGGLENAKTVAQRVQDSMVKPFVINGREIFTSASTGITLGTTDYADPADILRDADITMYRAKLRGKARFEVFDQTMREEAMSLLNTETDLRKAIEHKSFKVYYQPIISLENNEISSFEALVRWDHPRRGIVCPDEFIPLAEDTGLIVPIGEFVLRSVCEQIRVWEQEGFDPVRVAVNFSPVQIRQAGFAENVIRILKETGAKPTSLDLEITESLFLENRQSTIDTLLKLKELGIRVCLDDFGTGYSSLSHLQVLPIDVLKVDRSFVNRMLDDTDQAGIVETIVALGKTLGMDVTAEGIETPEQLARLKSMKCAKGQGYLFSRPVDTASTTAMLLGCARAAAAVGEG